MQLIPDEVVVSKIYQIRGQKMMIDKDLAELYDVETRVLKQAVRRNQDRFPDDFMFELTKEENEALRSQNATSNNRGQHSKYLPFAFTEHGVLMLSSVLNSKRSIQVNIQIMRIYTKLKEMLVTHKDLLLKMNELESRVSNQDKSIKQIFAYLKKLIEEDEKQPSRNPIGFKPNK